MSFCRMVPSCTYDFHQRKKRLKYFLDCNGWIDHLPKLGPCAQALIDQVAMEKRCPRTGITHNYYWFLKRGMDRWKKKKVNNSSQADKDSQNQQ